MVRPHTPLVPAIGGRHQFTNDLLDVDSAPFTGRYGHFSTEKKHGRHIGEAMAAATDARAQVIALGLVLGAHEASMSTDTWRRPTSRTLDTSARLPNGTTS